MVRHLALTIDSPFPRHLFFAWLQFLVARAGFPFDSSKITPRLGTPALLAAYTLHLVSGRVPRAIKRSVARAIVLGSYSLIPYLVVDFLNFQVLPLAQET
jgi:hypothetical protein